VNRLRLRGLAVRLRDGHLARNRIFDRLDDVLALGVPDVHLRLPMMCGAAGVSFIPLG
jgi:hypothetical protein